jgi:RNA polymerase sigma-70 factor (ECF subfamily)
VAQHFRKEQRQTRIVQAVETLGPRHDNVLAWLDRREAEPLEALVTAEMALLIRATLSSLSDDYEDLLTQKYLEGTSVEQMADQRAASETAVRSRLARARQAFRQAFMARFTSRGSTPCRTEGRDD